MRHICLYIGVQIFIAGRCAGPPEVVQEALADLKNGYQKTTAPPPYLGNFPKFYQSFLPTSLMLSHNRLLGPVLLTQPADPAGIFEIPKEISGIGLHFPGPLCVKLDKSRDKF